jgi:hypothetical protein
MRPELRPLIDSDTGALERRIPIDERPVFREIEASGSLLRYRPLGPMKSVSVDDEPGRLLENFLDLESASDETIEKFARQSGVLGLCAHGLPAGHENLRSRLAWIVTAEKEVRKSVRTPFDQLLIEKLRPNPAAIDAPCFEPLTPKTVFSEPLQLWRVYAASAGKLLRIAAGLSGQDRKELAETLDHWLSLTPLRLCCVLDKRGRLSLKLRPVNPLSALFGVLGIQVFFAASGSKSLLVCSNCGRPYMPKQLPRTGTHTYCLRSTCKKAALRHASRRHYRKITGKEVENGGQTQHG